MRFHIFGEKNKPLIVLIHGTLTPWQIWQEQIEAFQKDYYVIVPALDAHVEGEKSEFVSLEQESSAVEDYICSHYGKKVFALCGLSLGGAIANVIFGRGRLEIDHLVLDGAPLVPTPKFASKIMAASYRKIIRNSKARHRKTLKNFEKNFLPRMYLDSFLRFADIMTDASVNNMLLSVGKSRLRIRESSTKILYLHGTKGNEILSKRSAALIKKHYAQAKILCFQGYAHGELMIYKTDLWIQTVLSFFRI